jgi:hypothetical protein
MESRAKASKQSSNSQVQVCVRVRPRGVNLGGQADYSNEVVNV